MHGRLSASCANVCASPLVALLLVGASPPLALLLGVGEWPGAGGMGGPLWGAEGPVLAHSHAHENPHAANRESTNGLGPLAPPLPLTHVPCTPRLLPLATTTAACLELLPLVVVVGWPAPLVVVTAAMAVAAAFLWDHRPQRLSPPLFICGKVAFDGGTQRPGAEAARRCRGTSEAHSVPFETRGLPNHGAAHMSRARRSGADSHFPGAWALGPTLSCRRAATRARQGHGVSQGSSPVPFATP